jgi:hypothetical protein
MAMIAHAKSHCTKVPTSIRPTNIRMGSTLRTQTQKKKKMQNHCTPSLLAPDGARYERQRSETPSGRGATLLCFWPGRYIHSTRFNINAKVTKYFDYL